jgi:hypothetical protein
MIRRLLADHCIERLVVELAQRAMPDPRGLDPALHDRLGLGVLVVLRALPARYVGLQARDPFGLLERLALLNVLSPLVAFRKLALLHGLT